MNSDKDQSIFAGYVCTYLYHMKKMNVQKE